MARQASYVKTLLTAREEAEQRLGSAYKFRGAIVDLDNDASKLAGSALVPRREQTEEEIDDDFLGSTFNRIYADNRSYMEDTGAEFDMDAFIDDPMLQKKVGAWHIKDIDKEIAKIKNIPVNLSNQNGLRAVAHLGGIEGMKKFISSNGVYNKKDELGTELMRYYIKFSSGMEV